MDRILREPRFHAGRAQPQPKTRNVFIEKYPVADAFGQG
jgi:hypothetical protein